MIPTLAFPGNCVAHSGAFVPSEVAWWTGGSLRLVCGSRQGGSWAVCCLVYQAFLRTFPVVRQGKKEERRKIRFMLGHWLLAQRDRNSDDALKFDFWAEEMAFKHEDPSSVSSTGNVHL